MLLGTSRKQYPRKNTPAPTELRRRQPDRPVHRQRGKADVVAIEVIEDVGEDQDRHQPPPDLGEDAALGLRCGCGCPGLGHEA